MMRTTLVIAISLILLASCKSTRETPEGDVIERTGTVEYVDLEGGFYGIVAEDGTRYDPTNLEPTFQEDGLRVRFRVRPREGALGTHMWGTIVDVVAIERL